MIYKNYENPNLLTSYLLRFISTISFDVFFSSLSLLMIHAFKLSASEIPSLVALFFGFYYVLPIIGGKIGDYVKDFKQLFVIGKFFQLLSSLILLYSIDHKEYMYFGLALFLVDSMVNTVSLNMFITNCFNQADTSRRGAAFLNGHIWSNFGFIIALILSGIIYHFYNVKDLLYISAIFSVVTIIFCHHFVSHYEQSFERFIKNSIKIFIFMLLIASMVTTFLTNYHLTRGMVLLGGAVLLGTLFLINFLTGSTQERDNISKYFLFMSLSILFWTVYMIGPTFMLFFIDSSVNTIIFGFKVPPQWMQVIEPIMVVIFGLTVCKFLTLKLKKEMLFAFGLSCAFAMLFLFSIGINQYVPGVQFSYWWVVGSFVFLGIGETFLAPVSMALVGEYIPKNNHGLYTGINQMTIGLSVVAAGYLSETILVPSFIMHKNLIGNYNTLSVTLIALVFTIPILFYIVDKKSIQKDNNAILLEIRP